MKQIIIGLVTLALVLAVLAVMKARKRAEPAAPAAATYDDLSDGEKRVLDLTKEVYGDAILSQEFVREGSDTRVHLLLDSHKANVDDLNINLSSLARKRQQDGMSDPALKASLRF
jgi:hypothetical protein